MTIRGAMNRQSRPRSIRLEHHPWRDPRLILGVLLVLVSTVLGAAAVAAGSSSTGYWAVRSEVRAGDPVQRTDLVQAKAHVPDDAARHLIRVDDALPARLDDLVWARDIGDGALVSRASLADRRSGGVTELPLTVTSGAAPTDLQRGDRVDVWVGPGPGDDTGQKSTRVLRDVRVVSSGGSASVRGAPSRTVLVDVSEAELSGSVVSTVAAGHVTMVRIS
ncbi:hypothetical protein [Aeromicrobium sp.]|uniref:hypothetical protein n=1 Tax=Aeromicrobium sp. TaxID=1871063 RepID=UPI003C69D7B6